jgi:hypothetical protein
VPFTYQAAAYYFHGLILDEGETEKSQKMAITALQASEEFLNESKRASDAFQTAPPASRSFGSSKSFPPDSKPIVTPSIKIKYYNTHKNFFTC